MKLKVFEHIKRIPVLRPFLFFISGMLAFIHFDFIKILIVLLILIIIYSFVYNRIEKDYRTIKGLEGLLFLLLFGILGFALLCSIPQYAIPEQLEGDFIVISESFPVEKEKSWFLPVQILDFPDSIFLSNYEVKANLYFEKEGFENTQIFPGQYLLIHGILRKVQNAGNPDEFDYAGFLQRKNIYYTAYISKNAWKRSSLQKNTILYNAQTLREKIESKIWNFNRTEQIRAKSILIAIGLGNKVRLDRETKQEFSEAGAIHVMAVSGLHVGLIWMFLNFLFSFTGKNFTGRISRFVIVTMAIWLYALLTGLSPSVTRSCLMFSVAGMGVVLSKSTISLNTVFLAALVQILIQPVVIYDLGFQFSYSAVISILLFQQIIRNIFPKGNKLSGYFFDLISVSVSAQILTFPLTIYYFHQFPAFFLLTNILIIPLVTGIMLAFIASCFFLFNEMIFQFLLQIALKLTAIMAALVEDISEIPFSVVKNLTVNELQLIILLILPLLFLLFLYYKNLNYLKITFLLLSILILSGNYHLIKSKTPELVVFNLRDKSCVYIFTGKENLILSENVDKPAEFSFACSNYIIGKRRKKTQFYSFYDQNSIENQICTSKLPGNCNYIFNLADKKIGFLSDFRGLENQYTNEKIELDAIILGTVDFLKTGLENWGIKSDEIILSSAISSYSINCIKDFRSGDNCFYSVDSGAYILFFP